MSLHNTPLDRYIEQEQLYSLEGERGVRNLSKLLTVIGYGGYGGTIQNFLADNSGCIDAIIEWINEQDSEEWNESIREELTLEDDEEDDDDEEEYSL